MSYGAAARLLLTVVAAALLLSSPALAQVQINQNFIPQGPSPKFGPLEIVGSGDADNGANGTVTGAVQAILLNPTLLGPDTIFIGSTNGGIWRTTDSGETWKYLTDNAPSLSIASLALDTTDPTGMTLIAGVGITSSGTWGPGVEGAGGERTGLLYSIDGGDSWTSLGGTELANQSVIGVAARGNTIMAATFEEKQPGITKVGTNGPLYGLYRSTEGGPFELVPQCPPPCAGLPAGPVTALVADPSDLSNTTFYAAVTSPMPTDEDNPIGVYVTQDSGETWAPVFTSATAVSGGPNVITGAKEQLVLKLAAGPNGSVAVAAVDAADQAMNGLYLLSETGGSWSALPNPLTNQGDPSNILHLAVAIDPSDTSIVYVAGSDLEVAGAKTVPAFRVQGNTITSLTCPQFCSLDPSLGPVGTAHADARAFAIDAAGNLLMVGDGGIYKRTNPQSDNGVWTGLNTSTLQIAEPYQVGYGAYANRLVVAAQDTDVGIQSAPNNPLYNAVQSADGHVGAVRDVNDQTFANKAVSVYYTSSQDFSSLKRLVLDDQGNAVSPGMDPAGVPVRCKDPTVDPNFTTCETATGGTSKNEKVNLVLNSNDPSRIALSSGFDVYVGQDHAPANANTVDLTLTNVSTGLVLLSPIRTALAYGASDNPNVLLAGGQDLLFLSTTAEAGSLMEVPNYTSAGGKIPTSLVFGETSANFYVADSAHLWGGTLSGTIVDLTSDLPNNIIRPTSVEFINNSNGVDALLVGGLMRCPSGGCANSQSPIAVANSDNGNLKPFIPFGAGLPNALVYQMAYNSLADVLAIASVGRGVWTLYDVTSYFPQATVLRFGLAGNDSKPDVSFLTDGTTLAGATFVRPLIKFGTGTLTIAGNASYTGKTSIFGGTLAVNGSIVSSSSVLVNPGGTLAGTGTVGPTTVFTAGTLSPGNGIGTIGTLNVAGDLLFTTGSLYRTNVLGSSASSTSVTGTAALSGIALPVFHGGDLDTTYTILSAGVRTGTFDALATIGLPSFLSASLGYTATDVTLDLTSQIAQISGLTANHTAVGGALDNAFNAGGIPDGLNAALYGLSEGQMPSALDALSGELHGTVLGVLAEESRYVREAIMGRLMQASYANGSNPGAMAALASGAPTAVASPDQKPMALGYGGKAIHAPSSHGFTFWSRAYGAWANFDSDGNAASASRDLGGFLSGVDAGLGGTWRAGFATGYSRSDVDVNARSSSADVDSYHLAGYAGGMVGPIALRGGGAWAWQDIDTNRAVIFPGYFERETASYDGDTGQIFGEVAYPIARGKTAVEPFAGFAHVRVNTDGFTEKGGDAALRSAGVDETVNYSTLGLRFGTIWHANGMAVVPHVSAAWQHAFNDVTPDAALAFASNGIGFGVAGVPLAEDSALIEAGLDLALSSNATVGASYSGQLANDVQDHAVNGRFTWLF